MDKSNGPKELRQNIKKYFLTVVILFAFIFLGANQVVYSEEEMTIGELQSQKMRIEEMRETVNHFFVLAKDSDQRELIENALDELLAKMDNIQNRIQSRIEKIVEYKLGGNTGNTGEEVKENGTSSKEMIKKAFLGESSSVKCSYSEYDDNIKVEIYTKNEVVRYSAYYKEEKVISVVNKEGAYVWAYGEKEGMRTDVGSKYEEWEEIERQLASAVGLNCEYKQIDDSVFAIPEDVEFLELADATTDS